MASLSAGTPDSVIQSQVTLPIQVVGCAVYTPAKKTTHPVYAGVNITHTKTGSTITIGKSLPSLPKLAKEHPVIVLSHQRLQGQQDSGTEQQQEQKPEPKQQQQQQKKKQEPAQQPAQQQQQQSPSGVQQGAGCVSPIHFWKNCLHREAEQQNGRCAVVNKLPAGPLTPFFPQPGVKNNRHYKGVMGKSTNTGNKSVDMWFKAAQALVSTQLNELSGVALSQPVMDAVSLIGSVVGTTSTTPPTLNMQLPGLAPAMNLLEMFSSGQVSQTDSCRANWKGRTFSQSVFCTPATAQTTLRPCSEVVACLLTAVECNQLSHLPSGHCGARADTSCRLVWSLAEWHNCRRGLSGNSCSWVTAAATVYACIDTGWIDAMPKPPLWADGLCHGVQDFLQRARLHIYASL